MKMFDPRFHAVPADITPGQTECLDMLMELFGGLHRIKSPIRFITDKAISITLAQSMATYDDDMLTHAVILAHDYCIRLEIVPAGQRLKLILHKRIGRDGRLWDRHPTIETAIKDFHGPEMDAAGMDMPERIKSCHKIDDCKECYCKDCGDDPCAELKTIQACEKDTCINFRSTKKPRVEKVMTPEPTEKYKHMNHHHELTNDQEIVDLGTGQFVVDKQMLPLLKALNAIGLRTRSHNYSKETGEHFIAIYLDEGMNINITSAHENCSTRNDMCKTQAW